MIFIKKQMKKHGALMLSFLIPFFIMAFYFAYRNMFPFGNNTISTVDLGQQYIDLFTYYRHALLGNFSSIIYSFSNGLGGNMISNWSYYLMSPLNLILLFFPDRFINAAILLITLLKYGLSGFNFSILLSSNNQITKKALIPAFSTIYALNGWIIANQLNIIWLDGMILLPIIFLGIRNLFFHKKFKIYVFSLTAMIIINYYIAYMIIIFSIIYFIYLNLNYDKKLFQIISHSKDIILGSIISLGLSAWLLIPNIYDLMQGKARYVTKKIHWNFEYFPFRMIAKFFNGTFNFDQMPSGMPNIFIGSIPIIYFLLFIFNNQIKTKSKINISIVTLLLLLSMCFEPLDLVWHAMQFPVWYPYRFSFIFCFWIIWVTASYINKMDIKNINNKSRIIIALIIIISIIYIRINIKSFKFINLFNFIISVIFITILYILIMFIPQNIKSFQIAFIIIAISEMGLNAFNSLNNIAYIPNSNYIQSTDAMRNNIGAIQKHNHDFYRIAKTFYRSKDDPLNIGYNGGENFSSTINYNSTQFMNEIGQPTGEGYLDYSNGTLVSDSLLSFKYLLNNNGNHNLATSEERPDLKLYKYYNYDKHISTFSNPYYLPIGFAGNSNIFNIKNNYNKLPTIYQSKIINTMANMNHKLFIPQNFNNVTFKNTNNRKKITNQLIEKNNLVKPASINLTFVPKTNNPYYLTLGNSFNSKYLKIKINGKQLNQAFNYQDTVIDNIAVNSKNKPIHINIKSLHDNVLLQNFILYQFNIKAFKNEIHHLQSNPFKIKQYNNHKIIGSIKTTKNKNALITTIPYSKGWHLVVDHKKQSIYKWSNMFIGDKLSPGKHNIKLYYWPPYLNIGIVISIITLLLLLFFIIF